MSARKLGSAVLMAASLFVFPVRLATAHPLSPAALFLEERASDTYAVSFRRSELASSHLNVHFPASCHPGAPVTTRERDQLVDRFMLACDERLSGQSIRISGLVELSIGAIVHVRFAQGEAVSGLLGSEGTSFVVPRESTFWQVCREYVALGVEHLLTGLDHVLFVLGLMALITGLRRLLLTLTAFTLGHSLTLCLSALSLVRVPQAEVEVSISLSLVVLALEVVSGRGRAGGSRLSSAPYWLASVFGLLHGFGFASALRETGLPEHAIPLSLAAFNLGVELGQVLIVLSALPVLWLVRRARASHEQRARLLAGYAIGSLAAMWCIERALAL